MTNSTMTNSTMTDDRRTDRTENPQSKAWQTVRKGPSRHWVGDGFPVASVLSPQPGRDGVDPFLLMDHAGPAEFAPAERPRGVDSHPHRGFETVTVVFQGELEHRDSAGNSGSIAAGDVQWMTAGSGVLHEEKHSAEFTRQGGVLEMVQLWVNLPARDKMTSPRYQELLADDIPTVPLGDGAGQIRLIAGAFGEVQGAATTVTPVTLWDVRLAAGGRASLPSPEGHSAAVYVRQGELRLAADSTVAAGELAIFERSGSQVDLEALADSEFLFLGGEPLDEPIAAHGPFVMNTRQEIVQAIDDLRAGRFGTLG